MNSVWMACGSSSLVPEQTIVASDADSAHARLIESYNVNLAHTVDSSINGIIGIVNRPFGGVIPTSEQSGTRPMEKSNELAEYPQKMVSHSNTINDLSCSDGVCAMDQYVAPTEHYKLITRAENPVDGGLILYDCLKVLSNGALVL